MHSNSDTSSGIPYRGIPYRDRDAAVVGVVLSSDWRILSSDDRMEYLRWVGDLMVSRQTAGRQIYGDTFQGDPLSNLAEELIDALFYCFQAWRERGAVYHELLVARSIR